MNTNERSEPTGCALPREVFHIRADASFGHVAATLKYDRLIFVCKGELSLTLSSKCIPLCEGAVACIPAQERIRGGVCGVSGCEFYELELCKNAYEHIDICYPCGKNFMCELFSRLYDAFLGKDTYEGAAVMSLISSTLEHTDRSLSQSERACVERLRAEADRGIYSDASELLSLLALDRSAERIFARAYKISLSAYMTQKRLERAKSLLCTTKYTIGEIAERTGFAESNHFTKFFTYHTSLTPSNFRRRYAGICEREQKKKKDE